MRGVLDSPSFFQRLREAGSNLDLELQGSGFELELVLGIGWSPTREKAVETSLDTY